MALSRQKKVSIVEGIISHLEAAKMTVLVDYRGATVAQMESLRQAAVEATTTVRVVKNRLFLQAISQIDRFSDLDDIDLDGMRLCLFSDNDEVDGARLVRGFVKKTQAPLKMVVAINSQGDVLAADTLQKLASLPTQPIMLASVISSLQQPLSSLTVRLNGVGQILAGLTVASQK